MGGRRQQQNFVMLSCINFVIAVPAVPFSPFGDITTPGLAKNINAANGPVTF